MAQNEHAASTAAPALAGPVPQRGRYLKISMFMKKLPHLTDDYFRAYWANNHRLLVLENSTFTSKVRRYNQLREQAAALGGEVLEYDGVAEFWVETLEDWESVARDPDFVRILSGKFPSFPPSKNQLNHVMLRGRFEGDVANFVLPPLHVMLGYDYLVIGDNRGVE
ncbi:hypothetical protein CCHL11_07909 [Colletotrichum chlorophyti]|uniref:EthD domain-containing protein n=1 Tax=Colletotrichum chlorophyti TaxID=708187 RepID=A0A1Q8S8T3_9PEZI|nr:hypothetical protein CCHL11_07909 [Colletotrichum chlorophyti]